MPHTRWGAPPDDAYLDAVSVLFGEADREKPTDLLRWQYVDGPAGPATAIGLPRADGSLGAHYVAVPRRLWVSGTELAAAQSLDVMTTPDWRGRGLYLRLAGSALERLSKTGTEVVFGFPNDEAAPGFFGPLGWEPLGPVPMLVRPLLPRPRRRVGGPPWSSRVDGGLVDLDEVPDQTAELWKRVAGQFRIAVVRDADYLRWRLFERPGVDYVAFGMRDRGRLVGLGAVALGRRHDRPVAHLLELLVDPAADGAGRRLLSAIIALASDRGARALLAWCPRSAPVRPLLRRAGFAPLPARLRPVGVHAGVALLDRRRTDLLVCYDPSAWYFSYLDSDTV